MATAKFVPTPVPAMSLVSDVREFQLIAGVSPGELAHRVNEALKLGWSLYGAPMVIDCLAYFQAVVQTR